MRTKRTLLAVGAFAAVLGAAFFAGPRVDTSFHPKPHPLGADLERWLAESERSVVGIAPEVAKGIVWAGRPGQKTPVAIVYLHGFSATRQETYPLSDTVAARLGANLFYTRFTGHGLNGAALAQATANDWYNDTIEAVEIGKRLGDRVVVIGTSTGGTLALWAALQRPEDISATVLISPNFGLKDHRAWTLTLPWARQFAPIAFGKTYHNGALNPAVAKYWTLEYPVVALIPMVGVVRDVIAAPLEKVMTPILVIYSKEDQVVDATDIERTFGRVGATKKMLVPFPGRPGTSHHVLAGDIAAPDDTGAIAEIIISFLRNVKE